ncbi:hypothetical protein LTR37_016395 [Vermiconidia calcicola]|uniref:Uncharacterized protein n=1 Tax=Vermiconidia calcicola TaxID=1690605 RepID=A0ACC3MMZ2_9PEZI|nr:hypothetical protein LTR37_016395 [Vermiconidia calcicola]
MSDAELDAGVDAAVDAMSEFEHLEIQPRNEKGTGLWRPQQKTKSTKKKNKHTKTTALVLLGGSDFGQCSQGVLVDKIMTSIRTRVASIPGMILLGRTLDNFRTNYDPDATNVTSIKSRLSKLIPSQDGYTSVERLLCPLLATNRKAFPEIKKTKQLNPMIKLNVASYRSKLIHNQRYFNGVSWSSRTEATAAAVQAMRACCNKVDPESLLLLSPKDVAEKKRMDDEKKGVDDKLLTDEEDERDRIEGVLEWSLFDKENGFAIKVKACFDDPALRPAEYEDLVERTLYSSKRANPSAIYGPPKDDVSKA